MLLRFVHCIKYTFKHICIQLFNVSHILFIQIITCLNNVISVLYYSVVKINSVYEYTYICSENVGLVCIWKTGLQNRGTYY